MIEEIVKPDILVYIVGLLVGWVGIFLISVKLCNKSDSSKPLIFFAIISVSLVVSIMIITIINDITWQEQVNEQVEGLECDQLQEAYDIYKLESIKERFVFECIGQKEPWYK